jgi:hypothetical protein
MDYEKEASKVLDSRGHKPSRPQVLSLMGKIVNDIYDDRHADIKEKNSDLTSVEIQRKAMELTFKSTSVIQMDEWRKSFETNGYIKLVSPLLGEAFYLCRDEMFDTIKDKFPEVVYKASELPMLKTLEPEDIKCLHMGKKVTRGTIQN